MPTFIETMGTVDDILAAASDTTRPLLSAAHARLLEIHPDAVVVPRRGERSIAYGIGPRKLADAYAYLIPFSSHVNLGFFQGTSLGESERLEGNGKAMRHLKLRTVEDLLAEETTRLVHAAIAERRSA
jgi:hypothetical protein